MSDLSRDQEYLVEKQYKNSANLGARINLHRLYTQAKEDWPQWVFDRLRLKPGEKVLECGSGPGNLWQENLERIPDNCHIILSDLSEGMVSEAKANLAGKGPNFEFRQLDIQTLPFDDDSFDVVIANHMLYHVPDIEKGMSEVVRVLKGNGRFIAATNGANHMKELTEIGEKLLGDMEEFNDSRLRVSEEQLLSFRLENGIEYLEDHFSQVDLHLYESSLQVTEAAPLINYVLSMRGVDSKLPDGVLEKLTTYIEAEIDYDGHLHIGKESGLFVCKM